jgi:ADP-ribose pyrophosphatase YjhB (NUDIX family)
LKHLSDIDENELHQLSATYGQPEIRAIDLAGDEYLFSTRLNRSRNKRGEVVLAIERPNQCVLLHRKSWYEPGVYRLLSGTIDWDESVETALERELWEETSLNLGTTHFLGVLDCVISYEYREVAFVSYIFHLSHTEGELELPMDSEDISDFRDVAIAELPAVAESLRHVPSPRVGWGQWRALAHDFVYEMLGGS